MKEKEMKDNLKALKGRAFDLIMRKNADDAVIAMILFELGCAETIAGLYQEAEQNLQEALSRLLKLYPEAHPACASVAWALFKLYRALGDDEKAGFYYSTVKDNFKRTLLEF